MYLSRNCKTANCSDSRGIQKRRTRCVDTKLTIVLLFRADPGEAWTVFQRRRYGDNLDAVSAVGAAAAAADADPRVAGEQFVVGGERHDSQQSHVTEHDAGVLERGPVRAQREVAAAIRGGDDDSERRLGGQQQTRVGTHRDLLQGGQQQGSQSAAPCATHAAHQTQGARRLRRLRESPQPGVQEGREEGLRIHAHGRRSVDSRNED